VWLALGYGLRNVRDGGWVDALYAGATLVAVAATAVELFAPAAEASWLTFLVTGITFAGLFLVLRQDVYAYLLTLSLSLMAFAWIKVSTTHFTQDVLFYLVIGAGVVGLYYLLPFLKKRVGRLGVLPLFSVFTRSGAVLAAVPVGLLGILLLSTYSIKVTAHPKFCTSCHYMGEYYDSWQHSSHGDVECVQCHYEPGVGAEVKGKMDGMVQLLKYVSHSYTTKPHGMVSNLSCMREGCHAQMDQSEELLLFRDKIRFRHDRHLGEHPRGKELNCVSCHGQMIQGKHISVTETTCVTCHFYGRGEKQVAVGTCETCHRIPEEEVTFMDQPFNHLEFLTGNGEVHCVHCHSHVTHGDGAISAARCKSCHLGEYNTIHDQERFHLVHVSKGHFDCLQCHDEISHGNRPMAQQLLTAGECSTCHGGERHSIQARVYAGTVMPDIEATPDVMYKAGVACDGCHVDEQFVHVGQMTLTSRAAGAKPCADCHNDPDYGELLTMWQEDTKDALAGLEKQFKALDEACRAASTTGDRIEEARRLLAGARSDVSVVVMDGSFGAHNADLVDTILGRAADRLEQCRALVAQAESGDQGEPTP